MRYRQERARVPDYRKSFGRYAIRLGEILSPSLLRMMVFASNQRMKYPYSRHSQLIVVEV